MDSVAHHVLKAQTIHNTVKAERGLLRMALLGMVEAHPVVLAPMAPPGTFLRAQQERQIYARAMANRALAECPE